jgi:diguanylate cyclase (GGDEF)-like protein
MSIKKISPGEKLILDPIAAVKRRIFLVATPVGILIMLFVWVTGLRQGDISWLNTFILPLLASFFLTLVLLLWSDVITLRTFELIVYASVMAYALCDFASVIITTILTNGTFNTSLILWLPFVYILGFLILSTNRALWLSALFFLSTLLLGATAYLYFLANGLAIQNIDLLVEVYSASAFYIAVLYLVARIKEHYASELVVADDMSKLAMTDSVTQLNNRRLLNHYLKEEVNRAERHNQPLSILLFDLDLFKKINDTHGHNAGDDVLHEVAQLLRQIVRTSDPFGRWGGDEFLCLATNTTGEKAVELAERLRDAVQQHNFGVAGKVTASFGVTSYQKGDKPETLIRRADLGLYKAKAGGRNRVEAVRAGITLPLFEGEKPYMVSEDKPAQANGPGNDPKK